MKSLIRLVLVLIVLLVTAEAGASPFLLVNGGSGGAKDNRSSFGIEVGGTHAILNLLPLSAELSVKSSFDSIPSDTNSNINRLDEPYTVKEYSDGPEFGYLLKSGFNLNNSVPNLTLQLGGGYALQRVITIATGMVSGTHWQQGNIKRDVVPVGYAGLLYRLNSICFTAGYNIRRGVVLGIGMSW